MLQDLWTAVGKDVLVSVITGVVLFVGSFLWRRFQNYRIQQKYPVGGRYLSYYEDQKDGQPYVAKAAIVLKQWGYKFLGTTENLERKREWTLEGKIVGHGLLSGIYYPSSPHDPGRGMFFMEPKVDALGEYTGIWAGYDSVNRGVTCGKYHWRRLMDVTLAPLPREGKAKDAALALLRQGLGAGYVEEPELLDYQAGKSNGMALGAFAGDELVGVLLARMLDRETVVEYESLAKGAGAAVALVGHRLGILKSVVVRQSCRRQGVATTLAKEGLRRLEQAGATAVVAVSWESGEKDSSAGMLQALGLQRVVRIPEFWKEDSIRKGYSCPKCGNPCHCAALLYLKEY